MMSMKSDQRFPKKNASMMGLQKATVRGCMTKETK